jgi:hypothetical protein
MKFILLLIRELKLLLNKKFSAYVLFLLSVILISCGEKKETPPAKDYNAPAVLIKELKSVLNMDIKVAYAGFFDSNQVQEFVAGTEINTKDTWGIKFFMLTRDNGEFRMIFETDVLEGSFENSSTEKLNLPSYNYEMIYYNSLDYFMGSGGGEVFSYIIDLNRKEVYYAHLVTEGKQISLFLSSNTEDDEVKSFFLNIFRKDYPSFSLVDKDIRLDN